jgi:glycerophosphoryl diester phosphodiesterase
MLGAVAVSVFSIAMPGAKAGAPVENAAPSAVVTAPQVLAPIPLAPFASHQAGYPTEIVAHRGDRSSAPPDTPAAITAAFAHGADAVEFDVWETKDHQLVVLHDGDLSTETANCTGRVNDVTYAQYRTCRTADGQVAPNLDEALAPVRDAGKRAFIHVKTVGGHHLAPLYLQAVNKYDLNRDDHVIFFSDQRAMLTELQAAGAENIGLIFNNSAAAAGWASDYPVLIPYATPVTASAVQAAQARGQAVYPVESHPLTVAQAKALGVDGFLANHLAKALAVLR